MAAARHGGWWEEIRNVHIRADGQLVFNIYLWAREQPAQDTGQAISPLRVSTQGWGGKGQSSPDMQAMFDNIMSINAMLFFQDGIYKHHLHVKASTCASTKIFFVRCWF